MPSPRFTRENARQMNALAQAARAKHKADREALAANPPPILEPTDSYVSRRLSRVRAQLDLVDEAVRREASKPNPDGQRIDRLAAAQMRLCDQEFALAGRPKPGQRRPGPDRKQGPWVEVKVEPPQLPAPPPACGPDTPTGGSLPPGCEPGTPISGT